VNDAHGSGETFKNFEVVAGDLLIGDRVYGNSPGISYVRARGGHVLVRLAWNLLVAYRPNGEPFNMIGHLQTLRGTRVGEWDVELIDGVMKSKGRICAVRKSRQAAEAERKRIRRAAQKHNSKPMPETLEAAGYVMVFTTVDRDRLGAGAALNMYRGRWQIELVFKRLKSLMQFGHLRKKDKESTEAWLHGKLLIAFLLEALLRQGEALSPWGYPLKEDPRT
jgi:hypothetical protein